MQLSSVLQTPLWIVAKCEAGCTWSQGRKTAKATCSDYIYIQPSPSFDSIQMKGFGCAPLAELSRIRYFPWVPYEIVWSPSCSVTFVESAFQVHSFLCSYLLTWVCEVMMCIMCMKSWDVHVALKKWQKHDILSLKLFLCSFITLVSFKKLKRELTSQ